MCTLYRVLSTPTDQENSRIATIVVRGSTSNIMDDVERAVDDAVNSYKSLTKDSRFLPGAGATEIELAKQLTSFGEVWGWGEGMGWGCVGYLAVWGILGCRVSGGEACHHFLPHG